jgi:hypothetical protein
VSGFGEWADELAAVAARMEADLAITVVREQAADFIAVERMLTPKKTGALADSEHVDSISGGGAHAEATAGPHKIYAQIRNEGGTISKHGPGSLGNPSVGWFGHTVTQHGTHYVERSEAAVEGVADATALAVLEEMLGG